MNLINSAQSFLYTDLKKKRWKQLTELELFSLFNLEAEDPQGRFVPVKILVSNKNLLRAFMIFTAPPPDRNT